MTKYENVSQETLDKEFKNESPNVAIRIKEKSLIEEDGFITVHPPITTGTKS